jgi:hypothetical protein
MMRRIAITLYSTLATVVPVLVGLVEHEQCDASNAADGVCNSFNSCALTEIQIDRVRAAMLGHNATCVYNMSLSSLLGGR